MADLLLLLGVFGVFAVLMWLVADSDDDSGSGGLMQPALVPVRVRRQP